MPFSTEDLEALRRDLTDLPPPRSKNVSNRDAVGALVSELATAQRAGYSIEDLAQLLSSKGLRMTAGTLKGYLQQARKKKRSHKRNNGTGKSTVGVPSRSGDTAGDVVPADERTSSLALGSEENRAPGRVGGPRTADPAIGRGTMATVPPPPPSARRP